MGLAHGDDVLVADLLAAFAAAVVSAHTDEALWTRLAKGGLATIERNYSFDRAEAALERALFGAR